MSLLLKSIIREIKELLLYCWYHEVLWPIPLFFLLCLAGILATVGQVAAPYIYTLF